MSSHDEPQGHECDSAKREAQDIWGWARQITAGSAGQVVKPAPPIIKS